MRLRNRRALQDKTPGNSPQPTKARSSASKPPSVAKRIAAPNFSKSQLPTTVEDAEEAFVPTEPAAGVSEPLIDRELSPSPSPAPSRQRLGPIHSTPLVVQRRRAAQSSALSGTQNASAMLPPTPQRERVSSPLPPSSPPSDFEFITRRRSPILPIEPTITEDDEGAQSLDVYRDPDVVEEEDAAALPKEPSSDDPFGFLVVERKLKAQRAGRKHPHRAAAPAPAFHVLARNSSEQPPPQPLRSDDDDLYLDVDAEVEADANKENIPVVNSDESLQKVEGDAGEDDEEDEDKENNFAYILSSDLHSRRQIHDEEENEEEFSRAEYEEQRPPSRHAKSSTEDTYDPLRTPHAAHVSKDIYPMRSPFSSQSTPCDRELVIDSAPSSPSPSKPLEVVTPLRPPSIRPMRKLGDPAKSSQVKGKRKAVATSEAASSAVKKPRVASQSMIDTVEEPTSTAADPESPLKRPLRRSARNHAPTPTAGPSKLAPARGTRAVSKQRTTVENDGESESGVEAGDEGEEADEKTVRGKWKGKGKEPAPKKTKVDPGTKVIRRGRKPASATTKQQRPSAKTKGKRKAGEIDDEDEEAAKARRARIEYFKKLDSDYSLAKENVV